MAEKKAEAARYDPREDEGRSIPVPGLVLNGTLVIVFDDDADADADADADNDESVILSSPTTSR